MCTKAPETVDYETNNQIKFMQDLEQSLKKFSGALSTTMNSYRELLQAFDQVAQIFSNLAAGCSAAVRQPVIAFRDGMRDMKDKGPYLAFNSDINTGTVKAIDPIRDELKKVQKSLEDLKSKQRDYDSVRYRLEQTEKKYSDKDKPLSSSESYKKDSVKRDKCKAAYETKRDSFAVEVGQLQRHTENTIIKAMNNYLHCTSTFCGYLDATMESFRTDNVNGQYPGDNSRLDKMKAEAEKESSYRRSQRPSTIGGFTAEETGRNPLASNE